MIGFKLDSPHPSPLPQGEGTSSPFYDALLWKKAQGVYQPKSTTR